MARIRSSQRRKSATAAAVARDLDFPHFWRQLRAAGWTYKKPTGLATEGRYATPDGNGVFVGETAVVAYALEYGLMDEVGDVAGQAAGAEAARTTAPTAATSTAADVGTAAETGSAVATASVASTETVVNTGTVGDTGMADTDTAGPATDVGAARAVMNTGAVRAVVDTGAARPVVVDTRASSPVVGASQIDTTVGLSQGTLDHLFGSPNDSEDELSQAAVPHALGLSPHQFEADTSQREAAMNLHQLSEASGLESGADDDQERQRPATPPRTLRPRVVKKDVNFIPEDEDEKEYESMESGNESDGEGSRDYDFEEEPARDVVSDEDVLSEADAERMDEAFIRSLMIGNTSVTSQEKKQREDALRATQWTPVVSSDFEVDTPEYPGLGEHMALPVAELRAVASSPLQTFLYFMPKSLWVMIADETNRYSLQQLDQRAKGIQTKQHRRRRESLKQIRRRLKLKHEYKPHEILNTSTKFKKYYRSLFLGFVDMALVNSFLTHKETAKIEGTPCLKRGEWLGQLQNQLLQLKAHDFVGVVATPTVDTQRRTRTRTRHTHAPEQSDDWVTVSGVQKRRQRSCKVCALLRSSTSKKSFQTTWFCERCSVDDAKCWLCNKIRHEYRGVMKTCYEIWHEDFDAGEAIPTHLGKRVVLRRPAQKAGARKKTRRELQLRARDESKSGNGEESEDE
uniref:PiggyBac transposable element-derived protein domain-containing protein n=1 Tax=Phytophthora ramorum TaxID=164328 RepID=H3H7T8_PHYRM